LAPERLLLSRVALVLLARRGVARRRVARGGLLRVSVAVLRAEGGLPLSLLGRRRRRPGRAGLGLVLSGGLPGGLGGLSTPCALPGGEASGVAINGKRDLPTLSCQTLVRCDCASRRTVGSRSAAGSGSRVAH